MRPYPNRERALNQLARHPEPSLQSLSTDQLVSVATLRFGGPSPEQIAEMQRRMALIGAKLRGAFAVVRPYIPAEQNEHAGV